MGEQGIRDQGLGSSGPKGGHRVQGAGQSGQELAAPGAPDTSAFPCALDPVPWTLCPRLPWTPRPPGPRLCPRRQGTFHPAGLCRRLAALHCLVRRPRDICPARHSRDDCALPHSLGPHRPATITRRLTSISKAHQAKGLATPATVSELAVGETLKCIRRTLGTAQRRKAPLLTADLVEVLAYLPSGLAGVRDRALLLLGYAGAFRRSELAALELEHVAWVEEGAVLTLLRSKTDQQGQGRAVAIPRGRHPASCPVRALRSWIEAARITGGPLFRPVDRNGRLRAGWLHPDAVGAVVKRALGRAGFAMGEFGGHSLRAGFATQAAKNGATAFDIMRQTGAPLHANRFPLRAGSPTLRGRPGPANWDSSEMRLPIACRLR